MAVSPELLSALRAPSTLADLTLAKDPQSGKEILISPTGESYEIREDIPRFADIDDAGQAQTADAFGFKWAATHTYKSESLRAFSTDWLLRRYGFESAEHMRSHIQSFGSVLDIGCGSGFSTSLWIDGWADALYVGVDISSAIDIARERLGSYRRTGFVQGDALHLPFRSDAFGGVISEGVFHHTPSTKAAIREAARVVRAGGEVMFYVYRRKSPIREWTDDYVREQIAPLSNAEAWNEMESLTNLGRALADLHIEVDVPVDVPLLGISAGKIDVQRLIYWHLAKLFWSDSYSFEENVHVNFDWYRPRYAHRQTESEVRSWCVEAGLEITSLQEEPAGFTVRAIKRAAA